MIRYYNMVYVFLIFASDFVAVSCCLGHVTLLPVFNLFLLICCWGHFMHFEKQSCTEFLVDSCIVCEYQFFSNNSLVWRFGSLCFGWEKKQKNWKTIGFKKKKSKTTTVLGGDWTRQQDGDKQIKRELGWQLLFLHSLITRRPGQKMFPLCQMWNTATAPPEAGSWKRTSLLQHCAGEQGRCGGGNSEYLLHK